MRAAVLSLGVILALCCGESRAQGALFVRLGTPVQGTLEAADQWHGWTFQARAGERVRWKLRGKDGLLPQPFLDGPSGEIDLSALMLIMGAGTRKLRVGELTLPHDGMYRLRLRGGDGTTGRYRVSARVRTPVELRRLTVDLAPGQPGVPRSLPFVALSDSRLSGRIRLVDGAVTSLDGLSIESPLGPLLIADFTTLAKNGRSLRIKKLPLLLFGEHQLRFTQPLDVVPLRLRLRLRGPKAAKAPALGQLLPGHVDSDGDGLLDIDEQLLHGSDPALVDTDGDGLGDGVEVHVHGTDPTLTDTDGDGFPDGFEAAVGADPLVGDAAGSFVGRVVGDNGAPLAGVRVGFGGFPDLAEALTDPAGTFAVGLWPLGVPVSIVARDVGKETVGAGAASTDVLTPLTAVTDVGTLVIGRLYGRPGVLLDAPVDARVHADLDGDGRGDVIVALGLAHTVAVFLGTPEGRLQLATELPIDGRPAALAVADFDTDGRHDLVVASELSDRVSLLRGDGAGGFVPWVTIPVGDRPRSIAVGDLDGQGGPDVLTGHVDTIEVLTDVLSGAPRHQAFGVTPGQLVVGLGDVDGDGRNDLVAGIELPPTASRLEVRFGQGNGSFGPPRLIPVEGAGRHIALIDLDGDGRTDVLSSGFGSNSLSVARHITFFGTATVTAHLVHSQAPTIQLIDMQGDGSVEVVTSTGLDTRVLNYTPTGPLEVSSVFLSNHPPGAIVDVDGDGRFDLVHGEHALWVLDDPAGSVIPGSLPVLGTAVDGPVVRDANGDGVADVLVATQGSVRIFDGTVDSTQEPPGVVPASAFIASAIAFGDLDGDGALDMLVREGNEVTRRLSEGELYSGPIELLHLEPGEFVNDLGLVDLGADGALDGLVSLSSELVVLAGDGLGALSVATTVDQGPGGRLATGDLDGDGAVDVVVTDGESDSVSWFQGTLGSTDLAASLALVVGPAPGDVHLADLDADGQLDLLTVHDGELRVALSGPSGMPAPAWQVATGLAVSDLDLGDLNGDGRLDVTAHDSSRELVGLFLGDGSGQLFGPQVHRAKAKTVSVADFDADGLPDLLLDTIHGLEVLTQR